MDIENAAVSAVKNAIAYCDRLKAEINSGDKEMMWDGDIFLFSNKLQSKETLIARIPVQLKGKSTEDINKKTISYPVEVSCLKGYLKDNGVVYFVVYISQTKKKEKIYYDCLLPYKIKEVLESHPHQKTINIKLKSLPDEPEDITDIFINFDINRSLQITSNTTINLDELFKKNLIDDYFMNFQTCKNDISVDYLFNHEMYLYARTSFGMSLPIMQIDQIRAFTMSANNPIYINDKKYYESYEVKHMPNGKLLMIGNNINIFFDNADNDEVCKFSFTGFGTLDEQIYDLNFLLELKKGKNIISDSLIINHPTYNEETIAFFDDVNKKLEFLLELREFLNRISYTKDLNYSNFSIKDITHLNTLINSVLHNKGVHVNSAKAYKYNEILVTESFNGYKFLLHGSKVPDKDLFVLSGFFNNKFETYVEYSDHSEGMISQYLLLYSYDLKIYDNIDYSSIYESLISFDYNEKLMPPIVQLLLKIIEAYDYRKEEQILRTALQLSVWIFEHNKNDITNYLNLVQCKKRANTLDEADQSNLQSFLDRNDLSKEQKAAVYILLNQNEEALKCISKLDAERQIAFKEFPIYTLLKPAEQLLVA